MVKKPWQHVTVGELVGIITVLGVIALAIITRQAIFSPGPLNAQPGEEPRGEVFSHQELSGQCSKCHAPPWDADTMAERCLDCHEELRAGLQNPHELHSRVLPVGEPWSCVQNCHTEHNGPDADLTLITEEHFSRDQRGFSLEGHLVRDDGFAFACVDCHPVALDVFNEVTCVSCHRDRETEFMVIHIDTFGNGCMECHDGVDTYGEAFNHNEVDFPLEGKHAPLPCGDCHQGARTVAALQEAPQDCYSCHQQDDEHSGRAGQDCAQCHDVNDWQQPVFNHDETNYPLTGGHIVVACNDCHAGDVYEGTPTDCNSCHQQDDEHRASETNCTTCHNTTDWRQVNFEHSQTSFGLTGRHSSTDCLSCHTGNIFVSIPTACNSCHSQDDVHGGNFGTECSQCHNTIDWEQVTFNHSQTAFPLTGAHGALTCDSCHQGGVYAGTPTSCYSCHSQDDAHNGSFGTSCDQCHNTGAWLPAQYNLPHTFPLDHHGAKSECAQCHPDSLLDYTCYAGCHKHTLDKMEDKHSGVSDFGDACAQCHPAGRK